MNLKGLWPNNNSGTFHLLADKEDIIKIIHYEY